MHERGHTIESLARATDLSSATIYRAVHGRHAPRKGTRMAIAEALGASEADLFGVNGHGPSVDHAAGGGVSPAQVQSVPTGVTDFRNDEAPADAGERLTAGARHEGA